MSQRYPFTAKVWLYPGMAAWHFVSVPEELSAELTDRYVLQKRGWGSLKVAVTVGATTWKTSIFPDKKTSTYLLPLKKEVRRSEHLHEGSLADFILELE